VEPQRLIERCALSVGDASNPMSQPLGGTDLISSVRALESMARPVGAAGKKI
jgi:hypothetical protein